MKSHCSVESLFLDVCGEVLESQDGFSVRGELGVFSTAMVTWLGIQSRLGKQTLNDALSVMVDRIQTGDISSLVSRPGKKLREGNVSLNSGGISRAQARVSEELIKELYKVGTQNIETALGRDSNSSRPVYLIDGVVFTAAHSEQTVEEYGQTKNRDKKLHYPRFRVVSAHNLETGICTSFALGTITEHEIVLAKTLVEELPKGAIIVMDRGFSSPSLIQLANKRGITVVVRLKESLGKKFLASRKNEADVTWTGATAGEVQGRAFHFESKTPGYRSSTFYLFSNTGLKSSELEELYLQRVQIETAIRHLKQTLSLSFIRAKTPAAIHKELYLAYLTFNLIRAVMEDTARAADISSSRLSFTATVNLCRSYANIFLRATPARQQGIIARFREHHLQTKLPMRKSVRSYPREVKMPRDKYPLASTVELSKNEKEGK